MRELIIACIDIPAIVFIVGIWTGWITVFLLGFLITTCQEQEQKENVEKRLETKNKIANMEICPFCKSTLSTQHSLPLSGGKISLWTCGTKIASGTNGQDMVQRTNECIKMEGVLNVTGSI